MSAPIELPLIEPSAPCERSDARRNRERILCAARELLVADGLDAVSMDDVAAAAGVGKGTLYRRFGDRSTLLRALIEEPERDFQNALIRGEPPLGPGASPELRLRAFGAAYLELLDTHAPFVEAAERLGRGHPWDHPVYAFYRTHVLVLLREGLGDDQSVGYLADALMGPLTAGWFLYQRRARGMSLTEVQRSWRRLLDAVLAS